MHADLGPQAIFVWLPGTIVGILLNLQVKRLGMEWSHLSGGTPIYITRLLKKYPGLGRYAAIGYWLGWVSVPPMNAIILTDLIQTNLKPLGISWPVIVLTIGYTLIPYVVALNGTRALGILHLFFVLPAIGFLLVFCLQGIEWLTFSTTSPGLIPSDWGSFNVKNWAKWFFIAVYAVYACETASSFVADSRKPTITLRCLSVVAWLIPIVYLGGSWVLMRLALEPGVSDSTFLNLVASAKPFWGHSASILVTFLIASGCLLSSATAVSNSPRILYQLALDGSLAPLFAVVSPSGILGPALVFSLLVSLICLAWGDVTSVVMVTGTGYLSSMIAIHLGLWLCRGRPEVRWPWWSFGFFLVEAVVLVVGGLAWSPRYLAIGLFAPITILVLDATIRRIRFLPFQPRWWIQHYRKRSYSNFQDFIVLQVSVLIVLVCGAATVGWLIKTSLDSIPNNTKPEILLLLLLTIGFVAVAIACWTTLPQVAASVLAREQAEHLFNIALDAILVIDENGTIRQTNPAAEQLFGVISPNLPGIPLNKIFPALARQPNSWPSRSEHTLRSLDNHIIVEAAVSNRFTQHFQEYLVIVRDITERKQAEAALRQAEENYRSIFENALEGIFQSSPDGRLLNANPAMARIFGYDSPEEIVATLTDLRRQIYVDPTERDKFRRLMQEHGQVKNFEFQVYRKDHSIIWAQMDARVVKDSNGQALYYEGIMQDISDRKHQKEILEAMVKRRTAQLEEVNAEIAVLNARLKSENLRMGAQLDLLREMQQLILPKDEELEAIRDLDIAGFMEPADEVGGDYYDVLHIDEVVTIGIGDVTGHGLESGILMVMTQTAVRTLAEIRESDPVRFLDTLNRIIYKNVERMNSDKNLTLAILNYTKGTISISGQHEETLVVRKSGKIERIDTIDLGFPIGLNEQIADFINHTTVELNPGDGVVLYTDGIPEAEDINQKLYGLERLCEVVSSHWHLSAEKIKQVVIEDVRRFIGEQKVFDDITLVIMKRQDDEMVKLKERSALAFSPATPRHRRTRASVK
jgi:PAS domain S-box-containing protein